MNSQEYRRHRTTHIHIRILVFMLPVLFVLLVLFGSIQPVPAQEGATPRPLILIYSQDNPGYGEELGKIIESDDRMDARILVVSQADLFRSMLYFPYLKVVIAVFNHDKDEGLSDDLSYYYAEGGGIIGMGFAGWWTTTRNASRDVFSLEANIYTTGTYNRTTRTFQHTLIMDQKNEINLDVGDFEAHTQRVIMRQNTSTREIIEPQGVTVLYRETSQNAPVIILREENGVAVTFAGFTGDDTEGVPTYYGHLTSQESFRKLFTNAVNYAWKNEKKYGKTAGQATNWFADQNDQMIQTWNEAKSTMTGQKNQRLTIQLAAFSAAIIFSAAIYRYTFKNHRQGEDQEKSGEQVEERGEERGGW